MALTGKPVGILGMYRSGTSSVAKALQALGVQFGDEKDHFPSNEFNPGGYFELTKLTEINRLLLRSFDRAYNRISPLPAEWRSYPRSDKLLIALHQLLERSLGGQGLWGWKEPITSLIVPVYDEVLRRDALNAHYVVCVRHPIDVANSQRKMLSFLGDLSFGMWLFYTLSALYWTRGASRSVVPYERLLDDPRQALEPCASSRGIAASEEELEDQRLHLAVGQSGLPE